MAANGSSSACYSTASKIRYLQRLELYTKEKPYEVTFPPLNVTQAGVRRTNLSFEFFPTEFRDFSTCRHEFSTDIQGFELEKFPTTLSVAELKDLKTVETRYHAEAEEFLKKKCGATNVCIFDTTIRAAKAPDNSPSTLLRNQQIMKPASDCHVDQAPGSVRRRVAHLFPQDAEELFKHRVRLINIWRPLVWPYGSNPLALCDWRTTIADDFTTCDHLAPEWEGETLQVYHNSAHEFWFAKEMAEDDVILIKMYDSDAEQQGSNIAMCTPHGSFEWNGAPECTQPRQSMEIRALVFS